MDCLLQVFALACACVARLYLFFPLGSCFQAECPDNSLQVSDSVDFLCIDTDVLDPAASSQLVNSHNARRIGGSQESQVGAHLPVQRSGREGVKPRVCHAGVRMAPIIPFPLRLTFAWFGCPTEGATTSAPPLAS